MKKNALIISLNFNPGHVSHLVASYKQCENLGYNSILYINQQFDAFIPSNLECVFSYEKLPEKIDLAFFLFPSEKNISTIFKLKVRYHTTIAYIFHEPSEKYNVYLKSGFNSLRLFRFFLIDIISSITVKLSDVILLPSKKALSLYDKNKFYRNINRYYLPLLYDDELNKEINLCDKEYFSYIGTIASDHSFGEFLNFVKACITKHDLPGLNFLIATKSPLPMTPEIIELVDSGRLNIVQGKPLSNQEINFYYSKSIVVWNAYIRTTQSGVLAKSFMFGTPVIILESNISEFVTPKENVVTIVDNRSYREIYDALQELRNNLKHYSQKSRNSFFQNFYYKNYNERMNEILKSTNKI